MDNITRLPLWDTAAEAAANEFEYGDIIPMEWLNEKFEVSYPKVGRVQDFRDQQFKFLDSMDRFRDKLLTESRMALRNVRGKGYKVILPTEQTQVTLEDFTNGVTKLVRKAAMGLEYIRFDKLSDKQRQENIDARMNVAAVSTMNNRKKPLGYTLKTLEED